jgi:hypothetical protein
LAEEPSAVRTFGRARTLIAETADVLYPAAVIPRQREDPQEAKHTGAEKPPARKEPEYEAREETAYPEDLRQRARTRFGGLLFLLGVVEELGLLDEIETAMPHRLFRWALHCLALTLVPAEPDDPAVLAFAGLQPEATPPSAEEEDRPSEDEQAICVRWTHRIRQHLREMLDDPQPLSFVCYRDAEIVADPGWIEVRLSLQDVSTAIRRAGLDLDPGWVPWLGVVVRFVYE